jgi:hypothetical protein
MNEHKKMLLDAWAGGSSDRPQDAQIAANLRAYIEIMRVEMVWAEEELHATNDRLAGKVWFADIERTTDANLNETLARLAPRRPKESDRAYAERLFHIRIALRGRLARPDTDTLESPLMSPARRFGNFRRDMRDKAARQMRNAKGAFVRKKRNSVTQVPAGVTQEREERSSVAPDALLRNGD